MKQYLEIAKIINTHGIHGDLKLELWCDSPAVIKRIKTLYLNEAGTESLSVYDARMHGKFLLLKAQGITNPEDGARYRGKVLYADRADIPKKDGDFFIVDLIGTPVIDADNGSVYGMLADIIENPANDLYAVQTDRGMVYLPAVRQFLIRLDPPNGIYVRPIPGMFTEAVWNDTDTQGSKAEDTP